MKRIAPYLLLLGAALLLSFLSREFPGIADAFREGPEGLYLTIGLIFAVGYGLNYIAPRTAIPPFVWAIFFGMALQPVLIVLTENTSVLRILVELLAALVLFGGGVEVPFKNFRKYFAPIASISLLGTLGTVFLFAYFLEQLTPVFGIPLGAPALLLMAAILASTDPTAIIPTLKMLVLRRPFVRDIAVSESAVNDVAGTILTRFFLVGALMAGTVAADSTVVTSFMPFLTRETAEHLVLEMFWGVGVGLLGAWVLHKWVKSLERRNAHISDPALFIAIPIIMFAVGSLVGGSGYLAAFVAGLLFDGSTPTREVRRFYETVNDSLIKPVIFVLLGAIAPLPELMKVMWVGIGMAFIFMFVIRPTIVFLSLLPWSIAGHHLLSIRELLFLSFIRETGVIPAVLILVAVASGVIGAEYIFAIGMWVILLTLIIEPPLTPLVARKLGIVRK